MDRTPHSPDDGPHSREGEAPAEPGLPAQGNVAARQEPRPPQLPQRRQPVHGVFVESDKPTIVYITICTKDRQPWLAEKSVHELLRDVWQGATAWSVGRYVIMPDHIHLFATPNGDILLDNWVRYWKSQFSKRHKRPERDWQPNHWDRRLRSDESYSDKWDYVRNNPVRHKLVERAEDWPYQGEINELRW